MCIFLNPEVVVVADLLHGLCQRPDRQRWPGFEFRTLAERMMDKRMPLNWEHRQSRVLGCCKRIHGVVVLFARDHMSDSANVATT